MSRHNIIRLGTPATDSATTLRGMVTHLFMDTGGRLIYLFQPRGLNAETGQPLKGVWVSEKRLQCHEELRPNVELPTAVLGTFVEDRASGFKGTAVGLTMHINGCVHIDVQPAGVIEKTGVPVDCCDFDIRRLDGPAIRRMTAEEKAKDEKEHPSPAPVPSYCRPAPASCPSRAR
jgi:hypothetical protein